MIEYWPDIDRSNYNQLKEKYETQIWEFKQEAIYYFYLDCKSLFTILEDFNKIVFKLFNVNNKIFLFILNNFLLIILFLFIN